MGVPAKSLEKLAAGLYTEVIIMEMLMDPVIGYAIFVLLFLLLAIWVGRQIEYVRKQIATEMATEKFR